MDFKKAAEELHENGFALIEDFLSKEEISDLEKRMEQILDDLDPSEHTTVFSTTNQTRNEYFMNSGDRISFFFEEGALDKDGNLTVDKRLSVNKIGHALHCQDPIFSRVTQSDKMKELVKEALQFKDPVICQSMYIFKRAMTVVQHAGLTQAKNVITIVAQSVKTLKSVEMVNQKLKEIHLWSRKHLIWITKQPKIGGIVRPHQDSTFLNTNPKKLVGVWIPLEDANKENSCLWVLPGSHKEGVHNDHYMIRNPEDGPDKPAIIFTHDALEYDESKFVPVEMKAGSLLLIHGEVVHKSDPNMSTRSRHAYTFHCFENEGVEYSKQNWLQPTERGAFLHLFKS